MIVDQLTMGPEGVITDDGENYRTTDDGYSVDVGSGVRPSSYDIIDYSDDTRYGSLHGNSNEMLMSSLNGADIRLDPSPGNLIRFTFAPEGEMQWDNLELIEHTNADELVIDGAGDIVIDASDNAALVSRGGHVDLQPAPAQEVRIIWPGGSVLEFDEAQDTGTVGSNQSGYMEMIIDGEPRRVPFYIP